MKARLVISAGLLVGALGGAGDGASIRLENPGSFTGPADTAAFLLLSTALMMAAGGVAGALASLLPRRLVTVLGAVVPGLCLFAWCGVRVHVRWFFGVPLASPGYLAINLLLLGATLALSVGAARLWRVGMQGPLTGRVVPLASAAMLAAAVTVLALPGGAARTASPDREGAVAPPGSRDVLLVTLDTTRADHLSAYGYPAGTSPAFDRLARNAMLWTDMVAPIPLTNPSHSSLFTGQLPRSHGVRNNGTPLAADVPTFVPALAEDGWQCAAFVSGIPLKATLSGLSVGFTVYDDRFSKLEELHPMLTTLAIVRVVNRLLPFDVVERRGAATVRAAERWLRDSRGPRFLWVHLFDPHTPYDAPDVLRRRFVASTGTWTANGRPASEWPLPAYDAEVHAADRALESLVRTFRDATDGEGVVVVTADHGEGLLQHGELTHGAQLYAEDLRVACVASGVGEEAAWRRSLACTTELAHLLPAWARGSAGDGSRSGPILVVETFAPEGRQDQSAAWHRSGRKLMVNWETGEELAFDLSTDPGETNPLPTDSSWAELREQLRPSERVEAKELDPEVVRRLRALGYVH